MKKDSRAEATMTRREAMRWSVALALGIAMRQLASSPSATAASSPSPVSLRHLIAVPKPPMLTPTQWGARKPRKAFRRHTPKRITLHHEGVFFDGSTPAPQYLRNVQRWSLDDRKWPDIPYHFLIDLKGTI